MAENETEKPQQAKPKSAMGITSLVLGIIALLTSFLPIINNFSALLALLGTIFGIVGVVTTAKGKKSGKGLAIAALVVNVIAFVIVLTTQSAYSAAIKDATSPNMQVSSSSAAASAQTSASSSSAETSTENMPLGATATSKDGLAVTVVSVEPGVAKYGDGTATAVTVSYQNNGDEQASFNVFDWKAEDSQGAQRSATAIAKNSQNKLDSGTLAAGGNLTGTIYFDGDITKVIYENAFWGRNSNVSWNAA